MLLERPGADEPKEITLMNIEEKIFSQLFKPFPLISGTSLDNILTDQSSYINKKTLAKTNKFIAKIESLNDHLRFIFSNLKSVTNRKCKKIFRIK